MKLYQPGSRGRRTMFVQPGTKHPNSQFLDELGKPKLFTVVFVEGETTVDKELGQYMLDNELAARSPLILPKGVAA